MKVFAVSFTVFFFFFVFYLNPVKQRSPASSESSLADRNYRRSYVALDDSFNYKGLTHRPGEDGEYVRRLMGQLIQKADSIASEYRDTEPQLYYTYLLASLTVPMHESSLIHFTSRDPSKCYFSNDLLVDIPGGIAEIEAREDGRNKRVALSNARFLEANIQRFYRALAKGEDLFKSCDELSSQSEIHQMLFSNDYADVGLMMINSTSHGSFFRSGKIFHVDDVVDYGLNYLFDGYEEIALNSASYSCLNEVRDNAPEMCKRFIRGAWAGKYNSGNVGQTCRFMDPNHKFALNDRGFIQKLNSIFEANSLYHQYLPVDSLERNFFLNLIEQHCIPQDLSAALDQILMHDYHDRHQAENAIEEEVELVIADAEVTVEAVTVVETPLEEDANNKVAQEEEPLPEVVAEPEPVREVIPVHEFESFQGRFKGSDVNLRILPDNSEENYCSNTKFIPGNPIFKVIGKTGSYFEIEPNEYFGEEECFKAESLFVHEDFIEVGVEEIEAQKVVRLLHWVSTRDNPGMRESTIVGTQGPGDLTVIDEKLFNESFLWISFMNSEGAQVWFYAGQEGQLKIEEVP